MDAYDSQRPLRVPSWSLHMQVANEFDLLVVAVRNVLRVQERIPAERRPEMGGQDVLELLRNVSEHWDEVGGRSASKLAADHPDLSVGGIAFTGKEIWIGGDGGVPLSRTTAWLWRVWRALVTCLGYAGIEVPDDLNASRFEGGRRPVLADRALALPLVSGPRSGTGLATGADAGRGARSPCDPLRQPPQA